VIDSDSLAISINSPSDLIFSESANINGDLPVMSGGYLIIDGSVHSQYEEIELVSRTLSPGDTSITLFAFRPASNGDLIDTLEFMTIENLGDADTSDFSSMEFWLDLNGDDIWQDSDQYLSSFIFADSAWTTNPIAIEVGSSPPTVFVLGDISNLATPDASFQGVIPINGCQFKSANDGPNDFPLINPASFNISNSALQVAYAPLTPTLSIGQTIEVRLTATNILSVPMDSVYGQVVEIDDSTIVSLDSSFSGPVTLAAGESVDFLFYYTAVQTGGMFCQLRAISPPIPDSSAIIQTNSAMIQTSPSDVVVNLVSSVPTAVIRGQTNVFPLSVQYDHPSSEDIVASLRLDSLRLSIEDDAGAPLNANAVFSRMTLLTGYTNLAILDNIPAQPTVSLIFSNPVIVPPAQQQLYTLLVDIDSLATATDFVLALENSNAILIVDENTMQPVTVDTSVAFPLQTASCNIDDPSGQMAISYTSMLYGTVNYGQRDAGVLRLRLRHPGLAGSSQIQLANFSFILVDNLGNPVNVASILDEVTVNRGLFTVGVLSNFTADTAFQTIQLNSPVTLSPGDIDSLEVMVSVREDASYPGFNFVINDSTYFEVRDLSSGSQLETTTDTLIILDGSVFPISSGWAEFKQPATAPEICLTSVLSSSIIGGVDSLSLIDFEVWYPSDSLHSSIKLYSAMIAVLDSLGTLLNPDRLFDRIGFRISDGPIVYQPFVQMLYGSAIFSFSDTGLVINPGDSLKLDLIADIEADVPYEHFVLLVQASDAIFLRDAADTSSYPGVIVAA